MTATTPEEICRLFQQHIRNGDVDAALTVYDPEAVFLNRTGELTRGKEALRRELEPFATARARFDFTIHQVVQTDDIALMHTRWNITSSASPEPLSVHAIEVARRQPDGSWCWLIGDPFTVGKHTVQA